ncbi:unnamed protein product [Periconia digitata]|uniref:Uncharacterized protein n=1 Tax=Periconia digitata TaxID=1303443 RepID=A0A9W4XKT0_9PLEO|nr:unnamed protein product [Periconia digitata]
MADPVLSPMQPVEQTTASSVEAIAPPMENGTSTTIVDPDVEMEDLKLIPTDPPAQVPEVSEAPTIEVPAVATPAAAPPTPAAAPTPTRNSPHPSATSQAPSQPYPHGSPTRVYLNQHVTPHLLEAMKHLAATEPEKPLKYLSEFLAQKSAELEG